MVVKYHVQQILVDQTKMSVVERRVDAHQGDINSVRVCGNERVLATCGDDSTLAIWKF